MWHPVKEFLTYTRSERRGISVLLMILVVLIIVRYFIPLHTTGKSLDEDAFYARADSFLSQLVVVEHENSRASTPGYSSMERKQQQYVHLYDTLMLELNTADTLDLQLLRGVGPWFAGNIVKYREALGGYVRKEQLLEVYGMDSSRYEGVAPNVCVDSTHIRMIDLNSASLKEMLRHPYLEYHVVKAILVLRGEKERIDKPEEILQLDEVYPELFDRLSPYLEAK